MRGINKTPLETRSQILSMLFSEERACGTSRALADVSINTVSKLLVDGRKVCAVFHDGGRSMGTWSAGRFAWAGWHGVCAIRPQMRGVRPASRAEQGRRRPGRPSARADNLACQRGLPCPWPLDRLSGYGGRYTLRAQSALQKRTGGLPYGTGTAPGFAEEHTGRTIALPGVP
jgi:hypothetical protein